MSVEVSPQNTTVVSNPVHENDGDSKKPVGNLQTNQNEELKDRGDTLENQNKEASIEQKTGEELNKTEQLNSKPSRELKLLLELSKEARLDTNISYKRKSTDPGRLMEKLNNHSPAPLSNINREEMGKRSMRSQNPEFLLKHKNITKLLLDPEYTENSEKNLSVAPNKPQKKKRENLADMFIGGAIDEKTRKLLKPVLAMVQNNKDGFCWRCHRDKVNISCGTCPRSYHTKCLKQSASNVEHWVCPECVAILMAESTKTRPASMKDMTLEHLCSLLKFALKRMMLCTDAEPFIHPVNTVEFPDYKRYIVQPMDLTKLEKNIKDNMYGSTNAFEADAKWMLHNSIIFNSYQSKLTTVAKSIIKVCKQEMQEIENCSSCYLNANTKKNWFVEVCPRPHILLWAKLKGFPYWPAKAMCTNSQGMVDVRFFGAHDRAWVPSKECFLFSQKDPNCNKQKRNDIIECIKEVDIHIENLKKVYGEFQYALYRTPFDPETETNQLQIFLPNYKSSPDKFKNGYQNKSKLHSIELENKEKDLKCSITDESGISKTVSESDNSLDDNLKIYDLNKEMEGYGTDEESDPVMYRHSSVSETTDEDFNLPDEETDNESCNKSSGNLQIFPKQTADSFMISSNNEISISAQKISWRNSEFNMKNDFNKINKLNVVEGMEVTLENGESSLKVRDKTSSNKLSQEQINSQKKELSKSPSGKCKIAERLMKRLIETDCPNETVNKKAVHIGEDDLSTNIEPKKSTNEKKTIEIETIDHIKQVILGDNSTSKILKQKSDNVKDSSEIQITDVNDSDDSSNNKTVETSSTVEDMETEKTDSSNSDDLLEEMYSEDINQEEEGNKVKLYGQKKEHVKKRKHSSEGNAVESDPIHKKLIKLVDINVIKKSLSDKIGSEPVTETILEKHLKKVNTDEEHEIAQTCVIKSEPNSDEETNDSNYMEAKRQYLSALNISERVPEKSKEMLKLTKFKVVDNISKIIDSVASSYSEKHCGEEILLKEDRVKSVQKQKARKTFPKPTVSIKRIIPPITKPLVTTSTLKSINVTESPKTNSVMFLTQSHSAINNIALLPPNQTIAYSTGLNNSLLTMVQHPMAGTFANIIVPTSGINLSSSSQNYIPQRDPSEIASAQELENKNTSTQPSNSSSTTSESVAILTTSTKVTASNTITTNTTVSASNLNQAFTILNGQNLVPTLNKQVTASSIPSTNDMNDDINFLNGIVPENITKAITDLMCRAPPKLKPRPPGPLSTNFDPGVSSSAGPVTSFVNSVSHRLTDYFRGMLIETLQDIGKAENPQALIACLKLEIEALKHKHNEELLEIKKNVNSILRDIQKSILEEKEHLIEETRTACEAEAIKRVEEAKSKQWCASCMKEAQFYCCWNTSYCDYPCQLKHWPKHMTKCAQNSGNNPQALNSNSNSKTSVQPLVLKKSATPKTFPGKMLVTKQANVTTNKTVGAKVSVGAVVKTPSGGTLTIVEPTPGSYELVGNGPISVGGKIINTTVLNKIKPGNIITVTSSANPNLSSGGITASQKFIVTQTKTSGPVKSMTTEEQK